MSSKFLIPVLMVGTFGVLSTEMSAVGILPAIADRFNLEITEASLTVSLFAMVVMISALVTPLLTSRFERKRCMMFVLAIFTAGNIASAFAPIYESFLIARIIPAIVHPIYCSLALTVAAESVKVSEISKAVSKVLMGVSSGMIIGVPITSFVANSFSFESAMIFLAAINVMVLLATIIVMPSMHPSSGMNYTKQIGILKKPVLLISLLSTMLLTAGVYGAYSYISEILEVFIGVSASHVSLILFAFGMMSLLGNVIAGRQLSKNTWRICILCPLILGVIYVLLFSIGNIIGPMMLIILVWGTINGIANNVQQHLIVSVASEAREFANGLFLSMGNMGVTLGTSICGLFIVGTQVQNVAYGGAIFLAMAAAAISVRELMIRRTDFKDISQTQVSN